VTDEPRYDSRPDTLKHSMRVGELLVAVIGELAERSTHHDVSKTESPEVEVFDEFTPQLARSVFGSDEYHRNLLEMDEGVKHHYAVNRHHPEHFEHGVNDMTLVDVIEMLADWRAASERHGGTVTFDASMVICRERFHIDEQLYQILINTAVHFGWLS
jgi:hypothetical protein